MDEVGISSQQALELPLSFDRDNAGMASSGSDTKTMIAVTGNCQSMFLTSVLNSLPGVEAQYFGKQGRFIPFEGVSAAANAQAALVGRMRTWKEEGHRVLLCEQVWPIAEAIDVDSLGGIIDGLVRFPNFEAYALWPKKKYTPAQCERLSAERTLRFDRANITASEKKATMSFVDLFDDRFKDTLLFDTPRHPSPVFFSMIVRRLLQAPIFSDIKIDMDDFTRRIRASRAINSVVDHPIDNRIVSELQCAWAETPVYLKWRTIVEGMFTRPAPEMIALIEELLSLRDTDPEFFDLIAPAVWTRYASAQAKTRDKKGADESRRQAIAVDPYNFVWRNMFIKTLRREKRFEEARALVLDFMTLAPEHAACQEMLGNIAMDEGDVSRAREHFHAAVTQLPRLVAPAGNLAAMNIDAAIGDLQEALAEIQRSTYSKVKWGGNRAQLQEIIAQLSTLAGGMRS